MSENNIVPGYIESEQPPLLQDQNFQQISASLTVLS